MISIASAWSTAIWRLTNALCYANNDQILEPIRQAANRLERHVCNKPDKRMKKMERFLKSFINDRIGHYDYLPPDITMAYVYMLNAVISVKMISVHKKSEAQKLAWTALNNALADLAANLDESQQMSVELGCEWADYLIDNFINEVK